MWSFVEVTGLPPPPRDGHTACMIGNQMYVFGGFDSYPVEQFGSGLYSVDLDTYHWTAYITVGIFKTKSKIKHFSLSRMNRLVGISTPLCLSARKCTYSADEAH